MNSEHNVLIVPEKFEYFFFHLYEIPGGIWTHFQIYRVINDILIGKFECWISFCTRDLMTFYKQMKMKKMLKERTHGS
jgi:hypothetical protein